MATAYSFEYRFKVEWEDLAPSLQSRFKYPEDAVSNFQSDLANLQSQINQNKSDITDLRTKLLIDLENKINAGILAIPKKISEFTNDADYQTGTQVTNSINANLTAHNSDPDANPAAINKHNTDENAHADNINNRITEHDNNQNAHSILIDSKIKDHNNDLSSHEDMLTERFKHRLRPPLKRGTKYEVGDIAFHDSLPSYFYLECIQAGTTGSSEPNFGGGE